MKKIALLCLALVLALGALGVGYASWTDTIFVEGTVCTGSVELEIVDCSNTWIWKMPDHGIFVEHSWDSSLGEAVTPPANGVPTPYPGSLMLVSYADADNTSSGDTKEITVTFGNAFPCSELTADFLIHYNGSIPAMVNAELKDWTDETANGVDDCALLCQYATVNFWTSNINGAKIALIEEGPVQMHQCDYVYCEMTLNLDQLDELENLCCSFTAEITAIQWNECPTPP